jgi:hypothetical protein
MARAYHIGTPGQPWGEVERAQWLAERKIQRSYQDEVLSKLEPLREHFDVLQYGALSYDPNRYPLFAVKTRNWAAHKPTVLVTGGVHGYETSGVQGALLFLLTKAAAYSHDFNLLVAPCVSPWGYETIQRWNPHAVDPNRSFVLVDSPSEEAANLIQLLHAQGPLHFTAHVDLHETTDTDESEFRPAKAARDGTSFEPDTIPDGFYLVGDALNPQAAWHAAIIASVKAVTHIAPPDAKGNIIGEPVTQEGVIVYPVKAIALCSSITNAPYATTTEVYPDSSHATPEQCNLAQVAALSGALDFLLRAR